MSELALSPGRAGEGPGFYGKLPARGDFITRRLPRSFVEPWDEWLQAAIRCSRDQLGEDWLRVYLTCPVWRFVLGAGLCGQTAMAGVMMPSVDRVGRYFPLMLGQSVADCRNPADLAMRAREWFDGLEALALSALGDNFELERFDAELQALGIPSAAAEDAAPERAQATSMPSADGWRIAIATDDLSGAYPGIVDHFLRMALSRYSLWWTANSEGVAPSLLVCAGLPRVGGFAAFLDGAWERWGWETQSKALASGLRDSVQ